MVKSSQFIFNLSLVALSIFILVSSLQISPRGSDSVLSSPMILPLMLSIAMLSISVINLFKELKVAKGGIVFERKLFFAGYLLILFAFIVFIQSLPFFIVSFLFLLVSFLYFRAASIIKGSIIAAVFVVSMMLIFEKVFQIVFP